MIIITCKKAFAQTSCRTALLTAGMSRAETVRFVFSDDWDGLSKTAVFTDGVKTVDVLPSGWDGDTVPIPHEILTTAGRTVRVGVYGTNASGVVLPTVWVSLGKVQPAAEPSGDASTDPTLPVWAQLQEIIGDLSDLTTKAKENLVAAINEAAKTGSGGAGSIDLRTADGYIQYSNDGGATWENLIALADLKGEKGDTGAPGPQGVPGEQGPQGETGPAGPQGKTGPQGPQGKTGPAGPQGKTGPAGQDGAPGKDGSPGKDGTNGAPGQDGFSPSASVAETATGATITITDKTGTTTAEIKNGKDGAPGKDGTNGKDGAPGADGAPGTPGANGTDGKDGTTFTPSVSAAGDLSWTNDGGKANPAPVNLKGPQGETGPQGPTGATGPQGAPGADYTLTDADKTEIAAEVIAGGVEAQLGPVPLPAPSAAAVGQIVKIKAVDASGKITQTEAVDLPTGDVTVEEVTLEDDTDAVSFSLDGCEMFALVIDCPVVDVNHTYALPIVNSIVGSFIVLNYADTKDRRRSVLQINKVSDGLWFFAFKQGNSTTAASANLNSIGSTTVINNMIPMEITHLGLKAYTNQSIPKGTKIYAIRGKTIL